MSKFPQNILVLLEPTNACNLRCLHCYHADSGYDSRIMSIDTLDKFLNGLAPHYNSIKIIWHGGEPLIAGYDFFKKAYVLFDKFTRENNCKFSYNIQTNGTLLTDELINLFKVTDTSISISYDGPFNSILRQQTGCVERIIKKLQEENVRFSCLSTISSNSVEHLLELYEFFKQKNISVKFNHIFLDGAAKENHDFSVSKEVWTNYFLQLFNYWLYDKKCNIRLASCMDLLHQYLGVGAGCINNACLFKYIAVDAYGDIYPCGRLIKNDFKLSNVYEINDLRESFLAENFVHLLKDNETRIKNCQHCKWFKICHGGCNASCYLEGGISNKSEFECYFTKNIFENIENQLNQLDISRINPYAKKIIEENLK